MKDIKRCALAPSCDVLFVFFAFIFFVFTGRLSLSAQTVSGTLDTKLTLGAGAGNSPDFFYGAEEYANVRLRIPAGEYAVIHSAFNLIAAAGTYGTAQSAHAGAFFAPGVYSMGENYAAIMELERLYVRIFTDTLDINAGLLRIPFGYSTVWGPMDFLNPRNPLQPEARLRGALGITASLYVERFENTKFLAFAAAPKDPAILDGGGARGGLSWENHWQRASIQTLYCFETPISGIDNSKGLHRMGLSFKAELELGLTAEFLYTLDPAAPAGIKGLSAGAGADYSLFDGKLFLLLEYLYSGSESVTAQSAGNPYGNTGSHYLYAAGTWRWSDFSALTLGCAANLEDISFTPVAVWEYQFLQGMTFSLRILVPLDKDSFNAGTPGELGPQNSGSYGHLTAGLKIRF